MGSLSASGIPVVARDNATFRKRDINITRAVSSNDTVANLVTTPVTRTISSGSIVRGDGTVEYREDLVGAAYMAGQSVTNDRVASSLTATRAVVVDLAGNQTQVVIPTGLVDPTPLRAHRHTGDRVVHTVTNTTTVVERIASTGVYG